MNQPRPAGEGRAYLRRIDPARNMNRFYALSVTPNLFGEWVMTREWGRIGRGGQVKATVFETPEAADHAAAAVEKAKLRKGYLLA